MTLEGLSPLPHNQIPQSFTNYHTPNAFAIPPIPSFHIRVDDMLALHMTVPANRAKAWRRAGGQ